MSLRKIVRKTKKVLAFRKRTSRKMVRQSNYRFEKMSFKFATFILLIAMGAVTLSTSRTNSFYNDIENSVGNVFQASTLGVGVSGKFVSGMVRLGEATTTDIVLSKLDTNNLDYQYFASTTLIGDDTSACDYITVSASSSPQNYTGVLLKDFVSATSTPMDPNQWDFVFAVDGNAPTSVIGKICNFKISYMAWQTNLPDNSGGFSDIAEIIGSIEIGPLAPIVPVVPDVVLNEFLPRPDGILCTDGGSSCAPGDSDFVFDFGNDSGDMPQGEWVELYNNGSTGVDLTGWYLADSTPGNGNKTPIDSDHLLVSLPIIPAHGWLVVYMNKPVYNNPGDTVRLFNASETQIDSYSYGEDPTFCDMEPTPNHNNDTSGSGGSCDSSNVPGNKSFARIPDGTGDWVDPIPTPGQPNKVEENVADVSTIANEILSGGSSVSSGSSSGGATDIAQDMEIANTTPSIIEPQPSPEATAGEAEPATAQTAPEEPAILDGASTESSGDPTESSSELPAVIPSEPEVITEPEPVTIPEPVVEVVPVAETPTPEPQPSPEPPAPVEPPSSE